MRETLKPPTTARRGRRRSASTAAAPPAGSGMLLNLANMNAATTIQWTAKDKRRVCLRLSQHGSMEAQPWSQTTCLVLIDIQTDFWSGNAGIQTAFPRFPEQISALLRACRGASVEVCHVLERANARDSPWHSFWSELNPGGVTDSSGAAEAWAAAHPGERQFYKHAYDAVGVDCGLEAHLRQASAARC